MGGLHARLFREFAKHVCPFRRPGDVKSPEVVLSADAFTAVAQNPVAETIPPPRLGATWRRRGRRRRGRTGANCTARYRFLGGSVAARHPLRSAILPEGQMVRWVVTTDGYSYS